MINIYKGNLFLHVNTFVLDKDVGEKSELKFAKKMYCSEQNLAPLFVESMAPAAVVNDSSQGDDQAEVLDPQGEVAVQAQDDQHLQG